MSAVTEPILSSQARDDAIELLNFTRDSVAELKQLAGQLGEQEAEYAYEVISGLCDGIAKMTTRLDGYVQREAERKRQARADFRKAIEDSLPDPDDPDAPRGALPEPSLQPSLRASDPEDEGAYAHYSEHAYPDGRRKPQTPGKPAELPQDRPDAAPEPDPDLPEGMGVAGIPDSRKTLSTLPTRNPTNRRRAPSAAHEPRFTPLKY